MGINLFLSLKALKAFHKMLADVQLPLIRTIFLDCENIDDHQMAVNTGK